MANVTASAMLPAPLFHRNDDSYCAAHVTIRPSSDKHINLQLFHSETSTPLPSTWWVCLPLLLLLSIKILSPSKRTSRSIDNPIPTATQSVLPRFIQNLKFAGFASSVLETGYKKFVDQAFRVVRADNDIVVLPGSLLDELARLPTTLASPHGALEKDLLGTYTGLDIILDSRIHHSIVQRKLTPRLGLLTPALEEELKSAMDEYMPKASEWTQFQPYQIFAKVSARLASRALVGDEFCRDPKWLDIAVNYTESLFRTIVMLRLFPSWMHRFLYPLLPSYWNGREHIKNSRRLLNSPISELLKQNDSGEWAPRETLEDSDVMHLLADSAKKGDRDPEILAHVEVLLALASVHTTLLRMVNVLYDLTANPDYIDELRAEVQDVHAAQGGNWSATSYDKLHKMDSILRESQRMSPPTTLGLKRMLKEDYTFENGLRVPRGTYVCMPVHQIENDPRRTPNPEVFDGMRSYRLRQQQEDPNRNDKFSFSSIDSTTLNFGYGKHACPGRHFASLILKMFFVKVLNEYEFEFLPGTQRPANYEVHEFLFCWPWQKMLIRRRADTPENASPI